MKTIPLNEYMKGLKQGAVAKELGVTQGALSQILKSGRIVFVLLINECVSGAFEIKPIGTKGTKGKIVTIPPLNNMHIIFQEQS